MRRWLGAGLALLLVLMGAWAQDDRSRIYTNPVPPPREALERLNLKMAWRTYIPMDGPRDSLISIRHTGKHLLVQTRSGLVAQLDAETGQTQWRNHVGDPYRASMPLTFNNQEVFVSNDNYLYALDRTDGSLQWKYPGPYGLASSPIADEDQLYTTSSDHRFRVYRLPNMAAEKASRAAEAEKDRGKTLRDRAPGLARDKEEPVVSPRIERPTGPRPVVVWSAFSNMNMDYQPVLSSEAVLLSSTDGTVVGFPKLRPESGLAGPLYPAFKTGAELLAPPGQYEDVAYIGSRDTNLYALSMTTGKPLWRFTAGTPINRQPVATQQDVYVTSERNGLVRLDRGTGEAMWRIRRGNRTLSGQPDVDQLLAVNPKFVYATDRSGRLVVLDRDRGTILSTYNIRDFVFLTPNEWTDRLYLAAQNGLLVCLHDREYTTPYYHREMESSLARRLARPVSLPPVADKPLSEVLRKIGIEQRVKIQIATRAFKDAGLPPIDNIKISPNRIDANSLREALETLLKPPPINATIDTIEETILVIPKKAKEPDKQPEKDKGM